MIARSSRITWVILCGILFLVALRIFSFPELNIFIKENSGLVETCNLLQHGVIPMAGLTPAGEHFHTPGPLYFFLLAIPYRFWPHVLSGYLFLGVLSLLTTLGAFFFGRRYFSNDVGLVFAAIFAVSWLPWVARDLEAPSCQPFLILALMWTSCELLTRQRSRVAILIPPLFVANLQLHYSVISLLPAVSWAVFCSRRWLRQRDLLVGLGLALLLLGPYLLVGIKQDLPALRLLLHHPRLHRSVPYLSLLLMTTVLEPCYITALQVGLFSKHSIGVLQMMMGIVNIWLWFALWILSCGWLVWTLKDATRSTETHRLTVLVLLWSVAPLLLWSWSEGLAVCHYFLPAKLGQALVMGLFIAHVLNTNGVIPCCPASDNIFRFVLLAPLALGIAGILLGHGTLPNTMPNPYTFVHEMLRGEPHPFMNCPRLEDSELFYQSSILEARPNK